jgi:hypothetical protein
MPLRDHFSKDVVQRFRWEGFHALWASTMVRRLNRGWLPSSYLAVPRVRLGTQVEVDIGTLERHSEVEHGSSASTEAGVVVYSPPRPSLTLEADLSQQDIFEVQVYDDARGEHLVAAIELISPGNKDRPQTRHDFVVKCASMLTVAARVEWPRQGGCVAGGVADRRRFAPDSPLAA